MASVIVFVLLSGCESAEVGSTPAVEAPVVEPLEGAWANPALRRVVDLQVERDGGALRELLGADDPEVRARAAFALASVQDPEAAGDLARLLDDPEASVRLEAAFALGQLELADEVRLLLDALAGESDLGVRTSIVEALGKRGDETAVTPLAAHDTAEDREEAVLALALSRLALREMGDEELFDALAARLTHANPAVRRNAAYFFGRVGSSERWASYGDELRAALDGYALNDPAAMHLLIGLGLLRNRQDIDRFFHWLSESPDWRIRANAARAMGTTALLEADGVREALFQRVESDPSIHVAVAASSTLTFGFRIPGQVFEVMAEWMLEGPRDRWHTHLPFLGELATRHDAELILAWTQRMRDEPTAVVYGIRHLAVVEAEEADQMLEELLEAPDPHVRAAAIHALGERWIRDTEEELDSEPMMGAFERALRSTETLETVMATRSLQLPAYRAMGANELLAATFEERGPQDPVPVLTAYLIALAETGGEETLPLILPYLDHPEPRVRATAGQAHELLTGETVPGTELPDPERTVDWAALEALGPAPRLHLETERGEIVVRLVPEQAPLTVQALAALIEEEAFDGTSFHRVIPNFVVQGGDFAMGDGTGSPGYALRSEFTRIPFQRGVIGMASAGKDTEGSQFFITHSMQPHLDGGYTAFGWVESGEAALDGILEGDRLLRARIVPGG